MSIRYEESKFAEMLLHIAARLMEDERGGATKLNKGIYFSELTHLRRHGTMISGCDFQKLPHGPAPRQLVPVRHRLIEDGAAELVVEDVFGRPQKRLVPKRGADLSGFIELELATINEVVDRIIPMTAGEVSRLSHEEPGWQLAELGETIPPAAASLGFPQVSTPTTRRLEARVAERYGLTASG